MASRGKQTQSVPEALSGLRNAPRGTRVFALMAALAVVALVAGCGGSSSTGATSSTTPEAKTTEPAAATSLQEFNAAAYVICERGDQRKSEQLKVAAGDKGINVSQLEGEHLITAVVLPIYTEVNDELAALPMPEGYESEIESIISSVRSGIVKSEAEPLLALQGKAFIEPDEATTKLGMKGCIF